MGSSVYEISKLWDCCGSYRSSCTIHILVKLDTYLDTLQCSDILCMCVDCIDTFVYWIVLGTW